MKTQNNFRKELARDFLALGSWVFYILVMGRAFIKPYRPFVDQIVIAGIILLIINIILKKDNSYLTRGLILVVFTILFYNDYIFTTFAIVIFLGLIITSYNIDKSKMKILKQIIIGTLITAISYYLATFSLDLI